MRPMRARPRAIMPSAPPSPATNMGAIMNPKRKMAAVIQSMELRRPRSARMAETGIMRAKKQVSRSCISRNRPRLIPSAVVPQLRAKTIMR